MRLCLRRRLSTFGLFWFVFVFVCFSFGLDVTSASNATELDVVIGGSFRQAGQARLCTSVWAVTRVPRGARIAIGHRIGAYRSPYIRKAVHSVYLLLWTL